MEWATATAAALTTYYPGFFQTSPPEKAQRAWQGILRPLARPEERLLILADLDLDCRVNVLTDGVLHHDPDCQREHIAPWYAERLRKADPSYEVLMVDFGSDRHPRVFASHPAISGILFPTHPHLRQDQPGWHHNTPLHALCTYLSSGGANPADELTLVRALDFASIFLAKHTVWTRTAALVAYEPGRAPRTIATEHAPLGLHFRPSKTARGEYRWEGYWPGNAAPHAPAQLLASIGPEDECPCGKRNSYRNCCRSGHIEAAAKPRRIPRPPIPHAA